MAKREIIGVKIKLATPERIREISSGEVKKPETINYRTLRPEKDGLFCERIFGPTRNYECACGKYKRSGPKFRGVVCDRCGVEVTDNRVRRERMGHIELAVPVVHIWYLRGIPSRLSLLLGTSAKDLEKVVYFAPTRKNEPAWKVTAVSSNGELVRKDDIIADCEMRIHEHYDPNFRAEEAFIIESVDDIPVDEGDIITAQRLGRLKTDYGDEAFKAEPAFELTITEEEAAATGLTAGKTIAVSKIDEFVAENPAADGKFTRARVADADAFIVTAVKKLPFRKGTVLSRTERDEFNEKYHDKFKAVPYLVMVDEPCCLVIEPGNSRFNQADVIYENQKHLCEAYDQKFEAGIGAEGVQTLLDRMDLDLLTESLREEIAESNGQKKRKLVKRLQVAEDFRKSTSKPQSMILNVLPVIPPDLRPLVQLDGGRFATSDLNDLYRRVINRNNRLTKLKQLHAPEIIVRNEKRMLQECVDALIDNGRIGKAVLGAGNRPLKSLTDLLRGKKGRFRQNLLGKRVDYSGRSVIVIGPQLKIYQCGLPKQMALELFKPFVVRQLVDRGIAPNVKSAKRVIERGREEIWGILEEIIKDHPVMLNRAPTLHRLGIQAFEPVLMEGKAIRLHPMVCTAFNADFDGDQMAVHVPLSIEAQAEARLLMLSANNLLSPASGRPVVTPTQDIVLGVYYLMDMRSGLPGEGLHFSSVEDVLSAFDHGVVHVNARVWLKVDPTWERQPTGRRQYRGENGESVIVDKPEDADPPFDATVFFETSPGRALFNNTIAHKLCYVNAQLDKKGIGGLLDEAYDKIDRASVVEMLDAVKSLGYHWAAKSGISFGVKSIIIPPEKAEITAATQAKDNIAKENYEMGLLTRDEYLDQKSKLWGQATQDIANALPMHMQEGNSVLMMVKSGARGSLGQMGQMAGIRGLMADPTGKTIDYPITANFREGMNMLEYFISTHGARKGLADTALRTAKSGYLTRRLVDVSQDLIITEYDCKTKKGICIRPLMSEGKVMISLGERISGRTALNPILDPTSAKVIVNRGELITSEKAAEIDKCGIQEVWVRSPLSCALKQGVCQKCYGLDLSSRYLISIGEAVGVIAAQSIGEPGTQLTMRTFHTGGVRQAEDITQGLPRIEQLFEVRRPRKIALLAGVDGTIEEIRNTDGKRRVIIVPKDGSENITHVIPSSQELCEGIQEGVEVKKTTHLTKGSIDPQQLLEVCGIEEVQRMLVDEIQDVYHSQGVSINNKHIEVILRKVAPLNRVRVVEEGDTSFVAGDIVWTEDVRTAENDINNYNKRYLDEAVRIFTGSILKSAATLNEEVQPLVGQPLDENALRTLLTPGMSLPSMILEHEGQNVEITIGAAAFIKQMEGLELVTEFNTPGKRKVKPVKIAAGTILGKEELRKITNIAPHVMTVRDRELLTRFTGAGWLALDIVNPETGEVVANADSFLTAELVDKIIENNVTEISVWPSVEHLEVSDKFKNALINNDELWGRSLVNASDVNGEPLDFIPPFVDASVVQKLVQGEISALELDDGIIERSALFDAFLSGALKGKVLLGVKSAEDNAIVVGQTITQSILKEIAASNPTDVYVRTLSAKPERHVLVRNVTFVRKMREKPQCKPFIHGITKAALATDSFLSAASFQQTAQILSGAAVRAQLDPLNGLKENVIIGHLIPAGTGAAPFRSIAPQEEDIEVEPEQPVVEPTPIDFSIDDDAGSKGRGKGKGRGKAKKEAENPLFDELPDSDATSAVQTPAVNPLFDELPDSDATSAVQTPAENPLFDELPDLDATPAVQTPAVNPLFDDTPLEFETLDIDIDPIFDELPPVEPVTPDESKE